MISHLLREKKYERSVLVKLDQLKVYNDLHIRLKGQNGGLSLFKGGGARQIAYLPFISPMKWMLAATILLLLVAADSQTLANRACIIHYACLQAFRRTNL